MILCGDAAGQLATLAPSSCRTCVTSPPYYGLRDYGVDGQIGLEETPEQYITRLVEVFREARRVLTDDGTLWINIADSYAGSCKGAWSNTHAQKETYVTPPGGAQAALPKKWDGVKPKDLIGIPWMLAFALRADGWYLRQEIIWYKPNCMPESVKDRCTNAHESIFLLSKLPRYYFNAEAIKEPAVGFDSRPVGGSEGTLGPKQTRQRKGNANGFRGGGVYTNNGAFANHRQAERKTHGNVPNDTGLRNKRSVWSVATRGESISHFATYPPELIRPCILAGSEPGDTVLDPFGGSGTTGVVASQEGRKYVLCELNPSYIPIIENRIAYEGHKQLCLAAQG